MKDILAFLYPDDMFGDLAIVDDAPAIGVRYLRTPRRASQKSRGLTLPLLRRSEFGLRENESPVHEDGASSWWF